MSLINKVTDECENLNIEENNFYAESMNKYHINKNLMNHPKLLIVGTLTPPQGKVITILQIETKCMNT